MNHLARILERVKAVVEEVDLSRVTLGSSNLQKPPQEFEANIVALSPSITPVRGEGDDDGFYGPGEHPNVAPVVNRVERSIMIEVVRGGKDVIECLDKAGEIQGALERDGFGDVCAFFNFVGDPVIQNEPRGEPFVMVALVFSFGYQTRRGDPSRAILNS